MQLFALFLKILREWTPQNLWTAEEEGKRRKGEEERGRKGGKGEGEGVMGGRQGHSCLTRSDDGPQERDADPLRALQLDVGPRARGAARLQPERSRTAQSARRSQRGAAAQAACAAQPRGRDALCAAAARMRRASSCANARPNRGEPASTDSSRGAAASGSAGRGYEERKVRGTCFLVRRT